MNPNTLINQGYRRVSNKYRTISRIDKVDWVDVVYNNYPTHLHCGIRDAVRTYYEGKSLTEFGFMQSSVEYEAMCVASIYRSRFSDDKIEGIPLDIFKQIPGSGNDITGYCEKDKI